MKNTFRSLIVTGLLFTVFNAMAQTPQQTRENLVTQCVENERRIYEKDGGMFFHRYFADVEAACIKQVGQTANPQAPQQQVQTYSSNLPACQGANTNAWSQCAGTKNYPTGDRYVGEWLNGKANGQGTYNSRASAATYTGQFAADTFSGAGTMTWTNGAKFVGQWKNDSAVSGTITYANGTTAAGTVRNAVFYATAPQQQQAPQQNSNLPARTQSVVDCGFFNFTLGMYFKNIGNEALSDRLLRSGIVWGKTALEIGALEGVAPQAIKAENARLSKYVSQNMAAYMETKDQMMAKCNGLLKSDSQILATFQRNN